jgi:hypothetical protein
VRDFQTLGLRVTTACQFVLYDPFTDIFPLIEFVPAHFQRFLGVFAELREVTIFFIMSVRPSAWNKAPTGRIMMQLDI